MSGVYHVPVLAQEVLFFLITKREGIYVDGTLGGGGHAELILEQLQANALYIAFDQDKEAIHFARQRLIQYNNTHYFQCNFTEIVSVLAELQIKSIDGLLLDLGVSSHQIESEQRGFSYMHD